ncbi:Metallophosphoesterase [Sodalis praecaptivus]|uniref:Metallophosphoesterase n=1 Tax=Sodalis praecaptivus TaxID=1239307 RepID=W0HV93_9GAMM|nr:metallophosphoesterase [Sodalis praecaptivus]AHF77781.1 Metallophosphoesterase [Sodalis praecaptivus]
MLIAQISDIHAAADNDNLSRLDRALAWLDRIAPDVLVLTGDLIDNGEIEGYSAIAARLATRPYPAFILPGNSDDRAAMRTVLNARYWTDGGKGPLHFAVDFKELRLIGLDTTVEGTAAGQVAEHLPWLRDALSAKGPAASLLFLHHHVFECGIAPMDRIMCGGSAALGTLLRDHPRRPLALATGHAHRPAAGTLAGIPAYLSGSICPANPLWLGSATIPPVADPPALMIHRLANGSLASHFIVV